MSEIGEKYMKNAKGHLVPKDSIKPQVLLEDQTARELIGHAENLSAQMRRFWKHSASDIEAFMAILLAEYGVEKGGSKGNIRLHSFDGLMRVEFSRAEFLDFGPELEVAKRHIQDYLAEATADATDDLKTLVNHAFEPDKKGMLSRDKIFGLRRYNIRHPKWQAAMDALADSVRVRGSKAYIRFYRRADEDAPWRMISLDMASVNNDEAEAE